MQKNKLIIGSCLIALSALSAPTYASEATLTIKDFIGTVTVKTSPNATLEVTRKTNAGDLKVKDRRGNLVIDGSIEDPDGNDCKGYYGNVSWSWGNKKEKSDRIGGYKDLEDYPEIVITAPDDVMLIIENAIPFADIGDIGSADLNISHCGRVEIGNITSIADIDISGSGDVTAKNIGDLNAKISGSGDLEFVGTGNADIVSRGSGDVRFKGARNVTLKTSGSSDVEMENVSGTLTIDASGSSDIKVEDIGGNFIYAARGSSDISIEAVYGDADITVSGSGEVDIDDGDVGTLRIVSRGSSNVDYGGKAKDAFLSASGSGDIYVDEITGVVDSKSSGSADIDIGS